MISIATVLVAVIAGSAFAQDDPYKPREVRIAQDLLAVVNDVQAAKLEKSTYLGIASTSAPPALREQLKLKKGVGLVVERVEKGSPAEQAGVKQYDIVEKLDDQVLMNAEQFAALVRMQEPGKQITLSIIRQGQPQSITATLVEKELPVGNADMLLGDLNNGKLLIESPSIRNFKFAGPIDPSTRTPQNMTITSAVGQNVLTITRDGDSTHLNAKDLAGNQIFDGPVDTEEQWKEVPTDIATEARRLISRMGLNIVIPKAATLEQRLRERRIPANLQPVEPAPAPVAPQALP